MSDIEIRELPAAAASAAQYPGLEPEINIGEYLVTANKKKGQKQELDDADGGIGLDAGSEPAIPMFDSAGRARTIITRQCWCSRDAQDECRYHNPQERGWEVCPSKPPGSAVRKPRNLWGSNPDFGKPRQDAANEEAEQQAVAA